MHFLDLMQPCLWTEFILESRWKRVLWVLENPLLFVRTLRTNLDFTKARDSEWQWHRLDHMQIFPSPQTDNHASTPSLSFFTGWMSFLPPNQQRQSTEGKECLSNYLFCVKYGTVYGCLWHLSLFESSFVINSLSRPVMLRADWILCGGQRPEKS